MPTAPCFSAMTASKSPLRFTTALFFASIALSSLAQTSTWTLDRAVSHAQQNNLLVQQGNIGLELNDVDVDEAKAAFLPSLNGSASHGYNWGQTIDPFTNQFATSRIRSNSVGIGTGLTLYNGMSNHLRLDQAEERRVAAEFDLDKTRNDIALQVASAFLSLMFAEDALEIADLNVQTTETQVGRIRAFVDAGAAPEADLLDLQAQLASDQSARISSEGEVALAKLQLAQAMRLSPSDAENLSIARPDLSSIGAIPALPSIDNILQTALTNFPEVKAGESRVRQQQINEDLAKTVGLPRLSTSWSYGSGFSGAAQEPLGDPTLEFFTIGFTENSMEPVVSSALSYNEFRTRPFSDQITQNVNQSLFFSLSVPIFNGWSVRNGIRRSQVGIQQAQLQLEQVQQGLQQSV
ncbi:MAG: TolC family protein, partial [Flavobacteriales bacterium]|nr:TolC family protein [Flavobacteriales bacterium]